MNELLTFWRISKVMWVVVMLITWSSHVYSAIDFYLRSVFSTCKMEKVQYSFFGTVPDWLSTNYVKKIIKSNTKRYISSKFQMEIAYLLLLVERILKYLCDMSLLDRQNRRTLPDEIAPLFTQNDKDNALKDHFSQI